MLSNKLRAAAPLLGAAALTLILTGCGDGLPRPYTCKGVLRINGQPAKDARVILYYTGSWGEKTILPMAWTEDDGSFVLSTYKFGDGAPAGDYEVTVSWPHYRNPRGEDGADRLQKRFADPKTSGLRVHVEPHDDAVLAPLEINATVLPQVAKAGRRRHD